MNFKWKKPSHNYRDSRKIQLPMEKQNSFWTYLICSFRWNSWVENLDSQQSDSKLRKLTGIKIEFKFEKEFCGKKLEKAILSLLLKL